MKIFFDSSAFAKRYINEPGSEKIDSILAKARELALCIICVPEFMSALNRLKWEKKISSHQYDSAKSAFFADIEDVILCALTLSTIKSSIDILEANKIRAMDSLHVASAREWRADLFVSADLRQVSVAKNCGLNILML